MSIYNSELVLLHEIISSYKCRILSSIVNSLFIFILHNLLKWIIISEVVFIPWDSGIDTMFNAVNEKYFIINIKINYCNLLGLIEWKLICEVDSIWNLVLLLLL